MKFHCDRCNKPYVIADERVRGKILKIRCKSCSAIITVRENMDAGLGEPAAVRPGALPGSGAAAAGRVAGPQTGALAPEGPPIDPDLDPEWYLSVGGKQDGPLSLVDAKEWIAGQDADVEVYCWRDGFDDWRLVEEVPFFQKVRRRRQSKLILVPPPPHVEEQAAAERLSSQSIVWSGVSQSSGDLQLEIDEPSRVVSLKTLAAARDMGGDAAEGLGLRDTDDDRGGAFARGAASVHPGELAMGPAPAPGRRSVMPLVIVVLLMVVVAAGLALWVSRRGADNTGQSTPRTSDRSKLENLGYRVDPAARQPADQDGPAAGQDQAGQGRAERGQGAARGARRASGTRRRDPADGTSGDGTSGDGASAGSGAGPARSSDESGQALAPLTPDDIIRESARSEIGFRRCYERARKNDPFLIVKSLEVSLSVSPAGEVSEIKLSDKEDSYLGQCITARIRKWRFRASTEGIKSQIPLVFEQQ